MMLPEDKASKLQALEKALEGAPRSYSEAKNLKPGIEGYAKLLDVNASLFVTSPLSVHLRYGKSTVLSWAAGGRVRVFVPEATDLAELVIIWNATMPSVWKVGKIFSEKGASALYVIRLGEPIISWKLHDGLTLPSESEWGNGAWVNGTKWEQTWKAQYAIDPSAQV